MPFASNRKTLCVESRRNHDRRWTIDGVYSKLNGGELLRHEQDFVTDEDRHLAQAEPGQAAVTTSGDRAARTATPSAKF